MENGGDLTDADCGTHQRNRRKPAGSGSSCCGGVCPSRSLPVGEADDGHPTVVKRGDNRWYP